MDKNILCFVKDDYKIFNLGDVILRILGLIAFGFVMLFCIEIMSPYGYDKVDFMADYSLPYLLGISILSMVMAFIVLILYKVNTESSIMAIRAISYDYICLLLFVCSLLDFNGYTIYFRDYLTITVRVAILLITCLIYIYILVKKRLPNYCSKKSQNRYGYIIFIPIILCGFRYCFSKLDNINIAYILSALLFIIAVAISLKAIEYNTKVYYIKKYDFNLSRR